MAGLAAMLLIINAQGATSALTILPFFRDAMLRDMGKHMKTDGRHHQGSINIKHPETQRELSLNYDGWAAEGLTFVDLEDMQWKVSVVVCNDALKKMHIKTHSNQHASSLSKHLQASMQKEPIGAQLLVTGSWHMGCKDDSGERQHIMHRVLTIGVKGNDVGLSVEKASLTDIWEHLDLNASVPVVEDHTSKLEVAYRDDNDEDDNEDVEEPSDAAYRRWAAKAESGRQLQQWTSIEEEADIGPKRNLDVPIRAPSRQLGFFSWLGGLGKGIVNFVANSIGRLVKAIADAIKAVVDAVNAVMHFARTGAWSMEKRYTIASYCWNCYPSGYYNYHIAERNMQIGPSGYYIKYENAMFEVKMEAIIVVRLRDWQLDYIKASLKGSMIARWNPCYFAQPGEYHKHLHSKPVFDFDIWVGPMPLRCAVGVSISARVKAECPHDWWDIKYFNKNSVEFSAEFGIVKPSRYESVRPLKKFVDEWDFKEGDKPPGGCQLASTLEPNICLKISGIGGPCTGLSFGLLSATRQNDPSNRATHRLKLDLTVGFELDVKLFGNWRLIPLRKYTWAALTLWQRSVDTWGRRLEPCEVADEIAIHTGDVFAGTFVKAASSTCHDVPAIVMSCLALDSSDNPENPYQDARFLCSQSREWGHDDVENGSSGEFLQTPYRFEGGRFHPLVNATECDENNASSKHCELYFHSHWDMPAQMGDLHFNASMNKSGLVLTDNGIPGFSDCFALPVVLQKVHKPENKMASPVPRVSSMKNFRWRSVLRVRAAAGDSVLHVVSTDSFAIGDTVSLGDTGDFEEGTIASLGNEALQLKDPIINNYTKGTSVTVLRLGRSHAPTASPVESNPCAPATLGITTNPCVSRTIIPCTTTAPPNPCATAVTVPPNPCATDARKRLYSTDSIRKASYGVPMLASLFSVGCLAACSGAWVYKRRNGRRAHQFSATSKDDVPEILLE